MTKPMVYIPTYKRWDRQPTLWALSKAGVASTLVIRPEELQQAQEMQERVRMATGVLPYILVLPGWVKNIGQTRQIITDMFIHEPGDRVIMMDDDLAFACRGKRDDNPLYLSPCDDKDIQEMVVWLNDTTEPLAGISAREGNNRKLDDYDYNARMMRAWSIDIATFRKIGARFDEMPCIEDFDVILQFLTKGYRNAINNTFTTNQAGSNTAGGCSEYRTLEVQADAARALAAKYPGIVKAVEKVTKGAWGGGVRTDVTVYWKKAYAQGLDSFRDMSAAQLLKGSIDGTV